MDKKLKTIFDAMVSFYNEGFKRIVIIAGADRVREYDITLNKYNGKKARHGFYNFERIMVMNAGKRDPESKGVEGVSGTKLRGYAESGDFTKFAQYMPKKLSNAEAKQVYNTVRKGLGLKEQKEFKNHIQLESVSQLRESYIDGKLFEVGDTVVVKESGEVATVKHLGSNYVIVEKSGNQYRKWLDAVEQVEQPRVEYDVFNENVHYDAADFSVQKDHMTISLEDLEQKEDYYAGLSKSTADKRKAHFNKHAKMDDDNPRAYKKAPGDATAKTKPSIHTKKFKQMFGEQDAADVAKKRIEREKKSDKMKHDRMMDRARLRDTLKKNRETK
jgi:hypothetical protein